MRARAAGRIAGGVSRSRLLLALVAGLLVTMASVACGGAAPIAVPTVGSAPRAAPTGGLATIAVPTAVPAPGSTARRTPGPITWDVLQGPGQLSDVASTGALLVAVGLAGSNVETGDAAGVWTSPDGRTWEPAKVAQPAGTMVAVAAEPGRLVAVGTVEDGTGGPAAWTSVDGRTWQALPASAFAAAGHSQDRSRTSSPAGRLRGRRLRGGGGRLPPAAWSSTDGLTWTHTPSTWSATGRCRGPVWLGVRRRGLGAWRGRRSSSALLDVAGWPDVGGRPGCEGPPQRWIDAAAGRGIAASRRFRESGARVGGVRTSCLDLAGRRHLQSQAGGALVAPLPSVPPQASGQPATPGLGVGGLIATDGVFIAAGEAFALGAASGNSPGLSTAPRWYGCPRPVATGPSSPSFPRVRPTPDPTPRWLARSSFTRGGCWCSGSRWAAARHRSGRRTCRGSSTRPADRDHGRLNGPDCTCPCTGRRRRLGAAREP